MGSYVPRVGGARVPNDQLFLKSWSKKLVIAHTLRGGGQTQRSVMLIPRGDVQFDLGVVGGSQGVRAVRSVWLRDGLVARVAKNTNFYEYIMH